jgi:carboxyl-terminal processing protease
MFLHMTQEDPERAKVLVDLLIQGLKVRHFEDVVIDDEFSKRAFGLYLKRLDFGKRFLTAEDVKKLDAYRLKVDDQVNTGSFELFDLSLKLLNRRIEQTRTFYQEILNEPFDFEKNESYETERDKLQFSKDEKALRDFWRRSLKYQTLTRLSNMVRDQEESLDKYEKGLLDSAVVEKSFAEMEIEARGKVLKSTDDYFTRIDKVEYRDRLSFYINALLNSVDPHTSYFPPQDKENFDISMSGRLEGIGAQLREQDGYIKVSSIVPGSASWKQGQLKAGDLIIKVGQGKAEPVDIVDMRIDYAVKLIRGPKGTEVRLTVKKIDGTTMVIPIIRDVVILEETYAKAAVVESANKKIGYIKLPKFYADFNRTGGRNCSEDFHNELVKLKSKSVQGVIIDLRNNSGGSLDEAVKIAGQFIKTGPVVQAKGRKGDPYVFRDKDEEILYDGPVVVLVNSFSASASEILAAAIQDYGRGVIIGSQTYGKGTVQTFMELDRFVPREYDRIKPLGAVKMTIQKFYRINGGATQLKGVTPDILLPDSYTNIEVGERELDNVMAWNEIDPVMYNRWNPIDLGDLRQSSESRIDRDSTFMLIQQNAKRLGKQEKQSLYPLNFDKYVALVKEREEEAKKYRELGKEIEGLTISPLEITSDTSSAARQEAFVNGLQKDAYLLEAMSIIADIQ